MAIKTFVASEVLTASDTNTFLANSGLQYISTTNLSGGATNVVGCFSNTYDNYRFIFQSAYTNVAGVLVQFQMLNGTTPASAASYNYTRFGYNGSLVTSNNTGVTYGVAGVYDNSSANGNLEIYTPFTSSITQGIGNSIYGAGSNLSYPDTEWSTQTIATSYDGIRFIVNGGSWSGGKVICYGYRKA